MGRTAFTEPHCLYKGALYITYLLTPWSRVLLEKLTRFAVSQEIPAFYGTRVYLRIVWSPEEASRLLNIS